MINFMQLVWNEGLKIMLRVSTWVLLILMFVFSPALPVLLKLGEFEGTASMAFEQSFAMYFLVILFVLIVASESVASEFTSGTIKLLLIRPWQRWKILCSKLLAVVLFLLALTLLFSLVNLILSYVLFPRVAPPSEFFETSTDTNLVLLVLYNFIRGLVLATFAFMLSALFRSSALAITLSILLYFSGNITNGLLRLLLKPEDYGVVRYMLFNNLDLTQYFSTPTGSFGVTTLGSSLVVLAVYSIIFFVIAWLSFTKRDVRA